MKYIILFIISFFTISINAQQPFNSGIAVKGASSFTYNKTTGYCLVITNTSTGIPLYIDNIGTNDISFTSTGYIITPTDTFAHLSQLRTYIHVLVPSIINDSLNIERTRISTEIGDSIDNIRPLIGNNLKYTNSLAASSTTTILLGSSITYTFIDVYDYYIKLSNNYSQSGSVKIMKVGSTLYTDYGNISDSNDGLGIGISLSITEVSNSIYLNINNSNALTGSIFYYVNK